MATTASTPSASSPYAALFTGGNPFAQSAQAQFEAAGEIARIGTDTMRQVMKQQQDLFLTMLERWQVSAGQTREPGALLGLPIEAARVGTEIALQNASELAEIARQAQADLVAVLTARTEQLASDTAHAVEEGAKEAGKLVKKAAAKAAEITADQAATPGE